MPSAESPLVEEPFVFSHQGGELVGVLHHPVGQARAALLLLHGWTGCRAGPHQMFVKLARRAQQAGVACLRFDFRGRGDSEGDPFQTSLSTMISDTRRAAQVMAEKLGATPLALVGDCSGCEVALGAAPLNPAVQRLALWSAPPVAADRAAVHAAKRTSFVRAYLRKALRPDTWRRLFGGQVRLDMVTRVLRSGGKGWGEEGQESDAAINWRERFLGFTGRVLFIYGSNDPITARCLEHYAGLSEEAGRPFETHLVEGANHAFYSLAWEDDVIDTTLRWVADWAAP